MNLEIFERLSRITDEEQAILDAIMRQVREEKFWINSE